MSGADDGLAPDVAARIDALPEHRRWDAWEAALARVADEPVVRRARVVRVAGLLAATVAGGVLGDASGLGALGVFFGFVTAALLAGALSTPPWRAWLRRRAAPHLPAALDAVGAPSAPRGEVLAAAPGVAAPASDPAHDAHDAATDVADERAPS